MIYIHDREYEVLRKHRFCRVLEDRDKALAYYLGRRGFMIIHTADFGHSKESDLKQKITASLTRFGRGAYRFESLRRGYVRLFKGLVHNA